VLSGRKKSYQMERVNIETGRETLIEIDKNGKGLGLSIVGGELFAIIVNYLVFFRY
jgi:uncharacterized protein YuzE